MRTKRITAKLAAVALGLTAVAATPAAAASAQAPGAVEPADSASCATGFVQVEGGVTNLPVRQWPSPSAPIWESHDGGAVIGCFADHYSLGERYTACGGVNANGYLVVDRGASPAVGYVYMTCVFDR